MSEINNNMNKIRYTRNIEPESKINDSKKLPKDNFVEEKQEDRIQDTGVLGRSQVHSVKGSDITKSVDEAVALAIESPEILEAGDPVFDALYEDFLKSGMKPEDAYAMAATGMFEFREIASAHRKH